MTDMSWMTDIPGMADMPRMLKEMLDMMDARAAEMDAQAAERKDLMKRQDEKMDAQAAKWKDLMKGQAEDQKDQMKTQARKMDDQAKKMDAQEDKMEAQVDTLETELSTDCTDFGAKPNVAEKEVEANVGRSLDAEGIALQEDLQRKKEFLSQASDPVQRISQVVTSSSTFSQATNRTCNITSSIDAENETQVNELSKVGDLESIPVRNEVTGAKKVSHERQGDIVAQNCRTLVGRFFRYPEKSIRCWHCNKVGHRRNECRKLKSNEYDGKHRNDHWKYDRRGHFPTDGRQSKKDEDAQPRNHQGVRKRSLAGLVGRKPTKNCQIVPKTKLQVSTLQTDNPGQVTEKMVNEVPGSMVVETETNETLSRPDRSQKITLYSKQKYAEIKCWKCRRFGHFRRNCEYAGRGPGSKEHRSQTSGNRKRSTDIVCWNCREIGHLRKDCKNPKKPRRIQIQRYGSVWNRIRRTKMVCWRCGEAGHLQRMCGNPSEKDAMVQRREVSRRTNKSGDPGQFADGAKSEECCSQNEGPERGVVLPEESEVLVVGRRRNNEVCRVKADFKPVEDNDSVGPPEVRVGESVYEVIMDKGLGRPTETCTGKTEKMLGTQLSKGPAEREKKVLDLLVKLLHGYLKGVKVHSETRCTGRCSCDYAKAWMTLFGTNRN